MAVTELCWLKPDPPEECRAFFEAAYPPMVDVEANLAMILAQGFEVVQSFVLPDSAWLDEFSDPLEDRVRLFRARFAADSQKLATIEAVEKEIAIYRKYSAYYGYVFFCMRR